MYIFVYNINALYKAKFTILIYGCIYFEKKNHLLGYATEFYRLQNMNKLSNLAKKT